ncbi:hypothetical protein GCM10027579_10270 [Calidifontibacter terrae]
MASIDFFAAPSRSAAVIVAAELEAVDFLPLVLLHPERARVAAKAAVPTAVVILRERMGANLSAGSDAGGREPSDDTGLDLVHRLL